LNINSDFTDQFFWILEKPPRAVFVFNFNKKKTTPRAVVVLFAVETTPTFSVVFVVAGVKC
jgi:hypothetical protein